MKTKKLIFILPTFLATASLLPAAAADDTLFADKNAGIKDQLYDFLVKTKQSDIKINKELHAIALEQVTLDRKIADYQDRCMAHAAAEHLPLEQSIAIRNALQEEMITIQEEIQHLEDRKERAAQEVLIVIEHNGNSIKNLAQKLLDDPYISINKHFTHLIKLIVKAEDPIALLQVIREIPAEFMPREARQQ